MRAPVVAHLDLATHLDESLAAVAAVRPHLATLDAWAASLALRLDAGARLLVAGNGGSAAHAQHLSSELVGRFRHDRHPYSALALHAEGSSVTAIVNDYGPDELFARQVRAHGRPGDVLVALSTSGASPNLLRAVDAAHHVGLATWAVTGEAPNPLAATSDGAVCIAARSTAAVQEAHQVVVHLLCVGLEAHLPP